MIALGAVAAYALPSAHPEKLAPEHVSADSAPTAPAPAPMGTTDWMGEMADIIGDKTLLDISVPGSHDALTFDLGHVWPFHADTPSALLHLEKPISTNEVVWGAVSSVLQGPGVGDLAVGKCQTQHATLKEQLDGGIRFMDWRMTQGTATNQDSPEAFIGTHTIATDHSAVHWIKELLAWLDDHPKEIVVLWMSSHGDGSLGCGDHNQAKSDLCGIVPENIKSKVDSCKDGEVAEQFKDGEVAEQYGKAKKAAEYAKKKTKEAAEYAKKKAEEAAEYAKKKAEEAKAYAQDKIDTAAAKLVDEAISNYGTYQYPGKVSTTKAFMDWLVSAAGDKIVNVLETPIDKTTLNELWKKKKQLVVYAAGYCELSGQDVGTTLYPGGEGAIEPGKTVDGVIGTPYAYPYTAWSWKQNRLLNDRGGSTMSFQGKPDQLKEHVSSLRSAKRKKAQKKKENKYLVLTMITSARTDEAGLSAKLGAFDSITDIALPGKIKEKVTSWADGMLKPEEAGEACGSFYGIPGAPNYCPKTTFDQAALVNYYLQFSFQKAFDAGYDFPNTIYVDGLTSDGKGRLAIGNGKSYPYSELFIHTNFREICGTDPASYTDACKTTAAKLPPLDTTPTVWEDKADGRLTAPWDDFDP